MVTKFTAFVALLIASIPLHISAAAAADNLRGVRALAVVTETLDADAIKCGLNEKSLTTSIKYVLQQSRLIVRDLDTDGYVYLNLLVLNNCAVNISLQVRARALIERTGVSGYTSIWSDGALLSGSNTAVRVVNQVESLAKKLVVDWTTANAKPPVARGNANDPFANR